MGTSVLDLTRLNQSQSKIFKDLIWNQKVFKLRDLIWICNNFLLKFGNRTLATFFTGYPYVRHWLTPDLLPTLPNLWVGSARVASVEGSMSPHAATRMMLLLSTRMTDSVLFQSLLSWVLVEL